MYIKPSSRNLLKVGTLKNLNQMWPNEADAAGPDKPGSSWRHLSCLKISNSKYQMPPNFKCTITNTKSPMQKTKWGEATLQQTLPVRRTADDTWPQTASHRLSFQTVQTRVWRIYSNIRIFEYIWHKYLFGHSFGSILFVRIYSDIRSGQICLYEYIQTFVHECVREWK